MFVTKKTFSSYLSLQIECAQFSVENMKIPFASVEPNNNVFSLKNVL